VRFRGPFWPCTAGVLERYGVRYRAGFHRLRQSGLGHSGVLTTLALVPGRCLGHRHAPDMPERSWRRWQAWCFTLAADDSPRQTADGNFQDLILAAQDQDRSLDPPPSSDSLYDFTVTEGMVVASR